MAFKKFEPAVRFSGVKVAPDELDEVKQYIVLNPSTSTTYIGTVTSATANAAFVLDAVRPDYPRNLLFSILGVAGGVGGSATVVGKDQFGVTQSESFTVGSANGGGSVAGTKIFGEVTSGTLTYIDGAGGTAIGTARLGFAIGTAAGLVAKFGLPDKIGALTDVKVVLWDDNTVMKAVNGGTITSSYVGTAPYSFTHGQIVAPEDSIIIRYRSTFSSEENIQQL